MAQASKDQNYVSTLLGVSSVDGITPVVIWADPVTHELLTTTSGGGSGTVTSVSVATANGFAGSVADPTGDAVITLTTSITGILKGNGTAISAATAGSDYAVGSLGLAGGQTIAGSTLTNENLTLRANAADLTTGQINITSSKEATNTTTASVAVAGGLAVAKKVYALDMTVTNTITGSVSGNAGTASAVAVGGITGLGTNVATALAINVGSAGAFITFNGDAGTPSALVGTNISGTAASLTAGVATLANTIASANEATDTTCFPLFITASGTQTLATKNNTGFTYNSNTNDLGITKINGLTMTASTGTFTLTNAKTLSVSDSTTLATNAITLGGGEVITFSASNALSLLTTGTTVMTFPQATDTVAVLGTAQTYTATQTEKQVIWTNNAITASGNAATVPITHRLHTVTNNSAATLTITMTTTSAVDGVIEEVRILDASAAAQTITWVNTEDSTVTAPTTSNGSTTLPLSALFQFNGGTSKWRCIATA